MGGCGSKTNENDVTVPQNQRQHVINQQFSQFLRLDHPLNVNHKYSAQFKIIPEQMTGQGIKRTNQYESRLTKNELLKLREEFWETRIEGRQESWFAIKAAVEADEQDAIAILAAAELKLVNKSIQILYDQTGHKFDVPIFCINEPVSYPNQPQTEVGLNQDFSSEQIKITVRSAKFQPDLHLDIQKTITIEDLRKTIHNLKKDLMIQKIRLFFNGREMQPHHQIGNYNIVNGSVVQAFCA